MKIIQYLSLTLSFLFFLVLVIGLVASDQSSGDMPQDMKYLILYLTSSILIFWFISHLSITYQHTNIFAMLGVYLIVSGITIHLGVVDMSTMSYHLSIVSAFSVINFISILVKEGDEKW